ncbi:hypothetical protein GCM10009535_22830 [Streptomyces thermocarboxydovorans]|uniref:Transcriptional regulator n=1 Tax=Streptomyces thermocarboxydovorans TaxID=59298 RepID=A0ABN1HFL2_9ACTN
MTLAPPAMSAEAKKWRRSWVTMCGSSTGLRPSRSATVPEHAESVLARLGQTVEDSYRLIDRLLAEADAHGAGRLHRLQHARPDQLPLRQGATRRAHRPPHRAAWDMASAPDPGRDPDATYTQLARRLDHHVDLRTRELGGNKPPQHVWHCPVRTAPGHTTTALHTAHIVLDSGDEAAAQGYLATFGDALYNIASATTGPHRAQLRAAAMSFNRARRSAIRADHQAATALRKAAKELAYASSEPGGPAVALLFATVHLARAAAKWHERRGHEQQAAAAEEAFRHLQAAYQQAAAPVLADLARRAPGHPQHPRHPRHCSTSPTPVPSPPWARRPQLPAPCWQPRTPCSAKTVPSPAIPSSADQPPALSQATRHER